MYPLYSQASTQGCSGIAEYRIRAPGLAHKTTATTWLARIGIQKEFPKGSALRVEEEDEGNIVTGATLDATST